MRIRILAAVAVGLALCGRGNAEEGDDTLAALLAKSPLVVAGAPLAEPQLVQEDSGVRTYQYELEVRELLAGSDCGEVIRVTSACREEDAAEFLPFVKGRKSIYFLASPSGESSGKFPQPGSAVPHFRPADPWIGVQPYRAAMAAAVRRLAARGLTAERVPAVKDARLSGTWLLTMPRGHEYQATWQPTGEPSRFRLQCGATNLRGTYELQGSRLALIDPANARMEGLVWEIKNPNVTLLVEHPESSQFGSDYRNSSLTRR